MKADAHLPHLDGLRGLAALIVVISHAANAGLLPGVLGRGFGQVGVAVFFILSGFLMGHLYIHSPATSAQLRQYVLSRAARVLPLYYLALTIAGILVVGMGLPFYHIPDAAALWRGLALIHAPDIFWSIPVELHFYAVFVFLWIAAQKGRAIQGLAAVIIAQVLGMILWPDAYYVLFKWGHLFIAGVLAAMAFRRGVFRFSARTWPIAAWLCLPGALVVLPQWRRSLGLEIPAPFVDPVVLIWVGMIFLFALVAVGPFRALAHPALRFFGTISYSMYLLHMPIIVTAGHMLRLGIAPAPILFAGAIAATIVVAYLSLRLIERPAQRALLRRYGQSPVWSPR